MEKFLQIFKSQDLRKKVFYVGLILVVFRIFAAVPIPGVDFLKLKEFLANNQFFGFLNIFSGGGFSNLSLMMLGVGPYITATIILQLLTIVSPKLKAYYYEEGAEGQAKFNRTARYLTVPLAMVQAYGFLNLLTYQNVLKNISFLETLANVFTITAGTILLMWFGELISEYKIGNGISLIIFAGIVANLPVSFYQAIVNYSSEVLMNYILFVVLALVVIGGVVYVNESERKIPVFYAKQVRGIKLYGGVSSYLPIKVNQAGVIPIIFAISVLLFPQFLGQAFSAFSPSIGIKFNEITNRFYNNIFIYSLFYFVLVFVFTYFYTSVTFDPKEIAKNLQKVGGFIPGIRPGEATSKVIKETVYHITLFGALFLGFIAILPNLTQIITGIQVFKLGGTTLLILVAVALEVMKQIDSQLTLREYESIF